VAEVAVEHHGHVVEERRVERLDRSVKPWFARRSATDEIDTMELLLNRQQEPTDPLP
jgi:hypothetical protein